MGGQASKVVTVDIGPIGSMDGGAEHLHYVPADLSRFTKICIAIDGVGVRSVLFTYMDKSGNETPLADLVEMVAKIIRINDPCIFNLGTQFYLEDGEDISRISGTYEDDKFIKSISMGTRTGDHGPYGPTGTHSFILPVSKGKVIGFSGSYGDYINNFGVVIEPA
ncbi:hypothetical protein OSB04_001846 [Centaurea solstitialis]|uniref:Jacalin-type lectin domain-containing protein n=1 Tax=Centaurea solstitialis TaxID=347529 RepID=A0AA38WSW4_9ASTR|nr:hypothetical protein OSB04_001846 [Centaurea solstitialis]